MGTHIFTNFLHKFQPFRLTGGFIESEGLITTFYIRVQRVGEVGGIVWWILGFSLWWISLDAKLAVYVIIDLVIEIDIYAMLEIRPNKLVLKPTFLYLSWTNLIFLSPEVWRFAYYRTKQDYDGISCSPPLGEPRASESRSTQIGSCTLLKWIIWLIWPV